MECGQEYAFESPDQFWNELDDLIRVPDDAPLEDLDYALRNFIAFASRFMDEYLSTPGALAHAILLLLDAPLFTSHVDRMIDNVVSSIADPNASSSTLFISLMIVIFLRDSVNPLTALTQAKSTAASGSAYSNSSKSKSKKKRAPGAGITVGSSKIFRRMRKRWKEVVPVLMKWVWDAAVVEVDPTQVDQVPQVDGSGTVRHLGMPAEGWEERVGTTAVAVLYEMCRVQKLDPEELADFSFEFVSHLFALVERTRDVADETFNYTLIKLIIALNEQFMVSSVPVQATGNGKLPPPILPTVVGTHKRERGPNTVLEVLKEKEHESKTFGENVIFILNRADDSPDSLCVSLLILKILYLLFTTSGTQEYFYTNDLCVLVDVFIRELYNLGEDSEGLKHTYLRVLHPLLNNTQLRQYPYKRQELRKCLESLLAGAQYRDVDPTTRRLVERNLRGTWCEGLRNSDGGLTPAERLLGTKEGAGASTLSVDAVAVAEEDEPAAIPAKARRHPRQQSTSSSSGGGGGGAEPHRKSRRHASADDLKHHSPSGGSYAEEMYSQSPTEDSFSPHAVSRAQFETGESIRSASAGHGTPRSGLLERYNAVNTAPVRPSSAVDVTRSTPSIVGTRTSSQTQDHHAPILQHPRPRSSSLSAACHSSLGLGGGGVSRDSSAPPTPPLPIPPSPALSNVSLATSVDSSGTGPTSPLSATSGSGHHGHHHHRRRRPPPPPTPAATDVVGGVGSRPMTPMSRASTAGTVDSVHSTSSGLVAVATAAAPSAVYPAAQHGSPQSAASTTTSGGGGGRRRPPPPPPKPGGLRGDKPHDAETDARRLLDGLAVST
ncbi:hypothetical protein JCM10908_005058 [Rhodotorula pacifica]|uniref:Ldb17p n=1 Tax=Rhodotorula pacifica TaxID=1495444 RepID=UPI00316F8BDE